jgi:hypothetical protein
MKTIILRPSVATVFEKNELQNAFADMKLIDKTVCEDRIVYVFSEIQEKYKG